MNWIGGARSRLNRRNEKRKQEQFFEEKRKAKQLNNTTTTSHFQSSSLHLSQDILSIKTLSNAYSDKSVGSCKQRKHARYVDLDHGKPNSRFISLKDHDDSFEKNIKPSKLPLGGNDEGIKSCFPEEKVDFSIRKGANRMVDFLEESVIDESKVFEKSLSNSEESLVEEAEIDKHKETVKYKQKEEIKKINKESKLRDISESKSNEKLKVIKKSNDFFNLFNC